MELAIKLLTHEIERKTILLKVSEGIETIVKYSAEIGQLAEAIELLKSKL